MKKNYLLALLILLGNAFAFAQTSPKQIFNQSLKDAVKNQESNSGKHIPNNANKHTYARFGPQVSTTTIDVACLFSDDFNGANDTSSLQARGYKTYYRGNIDSIGTEAYWYQGDPTYFPAYNGPTDGYVASDYNCVAGASNVDNWLVLPSVNLAANDVLSFYSQSPAPGTTYYPDSIYVMYSAAGDSTPEGASWVLLQSFQVMTGSWEKKSFTVPTASPNGRLAIRNKVPNGGPTGVNGLYIGIDQLEIITPSTADGAIAAITSPESVCQLSAAETVSIVIVNSGVNAITGFPVAYTVDLGAPVIENVAASINPGDSLTYTFTATADLSSPGSHTIDAVVNVSGDNNNCNDTKGITVKHYLRDPYVNPYSMGFEPADDVAAMIVEDVDGDGVSWNLNPNNTHSGTLCAFKAFSTVSDDNWIFTGCLDLHAGNTFWIDYWYKTYDLTAQCGIESYVGMDQTSGSMTQLIIQNPIPSDTTYQHAIATFSVPTDGIYYVGFHAVSATASNSLRLDDIYIDDGTSLGIKENEISRNVMIFPNPSTGTFYLNSKAVVKNAIVEVFSTTGSLVYSTHFDNLNQKRIDLSNQTNGIYQIRIVSDSYVENHSVIVNR